MIFRKIPVVSRMPILGLFLAFFSIVQLSRADLSNGLGDHIAWVDWSKALDEAKVENKPLMVIIHKTSCPACKSLKPKFSSSDEISKLSNNFVMVNANNGEDPSSDPKLSPDGSYVPRILFLNPEGELLSDVINEQGNPSYKYYHYEATSVAESMKKAMGSIKKEEL